MHILYIHSSQLQQGILLIFCCWVSSRSIHENLTNFKWSCVLSILASLRRHFHHDFVHWLQDSGCYYGAGKFLSHFFNSFFFLNQAFLMRRGSKSNTHDSFLLQWVRHQPLQKGGIVWCAKLMLKTSEKFKNVIYMIVNTIKFHQDKDARLLQCKAFGYKNVIFYYEVLFIGYYIYLLMFYNNIFGGLLLSATHLNTLALAYVTQPSIHNTSRIDCLIFWSIFLNINVFINSSVWAVCDTRSIF